MSSERLGHTESTALPEDLPGPHPLPAADFYQRSLSVVVFDAPLVRIHRCQHDALFFGRSGDNRFDDPSAAFGTLYCSEDLNGAFVETLGRLPSAAEPIVIDTAQLSERCISHIVFRRPLKLVDFRGGPESRRMGVDARIWTGSYAIAQQWARHVHEHREQPDGILYRCRGDASRLSIALFERVHLFLSAQLVGGLWGPDQRERVLQIIDDYALALIDNPSP